MPSTPDLPAAQPRPGLPSRLRPHRLGILIAVAGMLGGLVLWQLGLYNNPRGRPLRRLDAGPAGRSCAWRCPAAAGALSRGLGPGDRRAGRRPVQRRDHLLATVVVFTDLVYAAVLYGSATPSSRAVLPVSVACHRGGHVRAAGRLRGRPRRCCSACSSARGVTSRPRWTGRDRPQPPRRRRGRPAARRTDRAAGRDGPRPGRDRRTRPDGTRVARHGRQPPLRDRHPLHRRALPRRPGRPPARRSASSGRTASRGSPRCGG